MALQSVWGACNLPEVGKCCEKDEKLTFCFGTKTLFIHMHALQWLRHVVKSTKQVRLCQTFFSTLSLLLICHFFHYFNHVKWYQMVF